MIGDYDCARSMRDEGVRKQRAKMLREPHIADLTDYAAELRKCGKGEVPDFDPLDGGVNARALFLFEKPGRMTSQAGGGSGFISQDNNDSTAEATFKFMQQADIQRKLTVIWNVVPWWNFTRKIDAQELSDGVACVRDLAVLLPKLSVVVLVGKKASRAQPYLESAGFKLLTSDHPSPLVRAKFRDRWNAIPLKWAEIHQCI